MKQVVADAAIRDVKSDMILGLGSGSTAALMIKSLADEIRSGKLQNIRGVATSFQSEVLALELDIPLIDLASVSQIDLAIDGADEVDPGFQLIKGGGACHVREKLVASKANQLLIVVDETKLVQNLNQSFPLPVEVLSLIHISEPTRRSTISYAVFCLKRSCNSSYVLKFSNTNFFSEAFNH